MPIILMGKFILFIAILTKVKGEQECALNTICKHIRDCPIIRDHFHSFFPKPYCNLHLPGTYVCCYVPQPPYTKEKDKNLRTVKECKSYRKIGRQCEVPLIVNGKKAEPKEFPFMALIYYKNEDQISYKCGGTLISRKYILTAAHCFIGYEEPNWIRLGELDHSITTDDALTQDITIKRIIFAPEYKIELKYNDIALIEMMAEAELNDYVAPACLPLIDGHEYEKYLATGWGMTRDTGDYSSHLLKVVLDHFEIDRCSELIERSDELKDGVNNRTQICAGSFSDGRDTCNGDSGGPLFVDHPDFKCQYLVLGITSFGEGGCGNRGFPAIYTRISYYVEWIESIIWT